MARRPVKKRKVVSTKGGKKIIAGAKEALAIARGEKKPARLYKPKVLNPKFKLEIGSIGDPFFINPASIPDGVSLQWIVTHVEGDAYPNFLEDALDCGWKVVESVKPLSGQVLIWAPEELAAAQRDANIKRARTQIAEINQMFGVNDDYRPEGRRYPLVSESFMVSSDYGRVPSETLPIDVEVKVNFRLSGHFQDAAACLKLAPEVYAQRRLDLYLRGELGGLLLPVGDASLELLENGNLQFSSRI